SRAAAAGWRRAAPPAAGERGSSANPTADRKWLRAAPWAERAPDARQRCRRVLSAHGDAEDPALGHLPRVEHLVELLLREHALLEAELAHGLAARVGLLGDRCRGVVADLRRQRGDHHERALDHVAHALAVRL